MARGHPWMEPSYKNSSSFTLTELLFSRQGQTTGSLISTLKLAGSPKHSPPTPPTLIHAKRGATKSPDWPIPTPLLWEYTPLPALELHSNQSVLFHLICVGSECFIVVVQ